MSSSSDLDIKKKKKKGKPKIKKESVDDDIDHGAYDQTDYGGGGGYLDQAGAAPDNGASTAPYR